jgi:two-component system LytT family sensor kinase
VSVAFKPLLFINPKNAALRVALVIWVFAIMLANMSAALAGRASILQSVPASIPLIALGVGLTLLLTRLRIGLQRLSSVSAFVLTFGALILAAGFQMAVDLYYYRWLSITIFPDWQDWAAQLTPMRFVTTGTVYLWLFGLAFTLLWALGVYDVARNNAARAEMSEALALRLQLDPHFMINTLNAVASLIGTGRGREAEDMTCRLTAFLRSSLKSDPTALVPLDEEIDTIEAYLAIEQVRSGDRLRVRIDISEEAGPAPVPNFILQPLAENAVKYGVAVSRAPVEIGITAAVADGHLRVTVANRRLAPEPYPADVPPPDSSRIGLANVRQRLVLAYGTAASLETRTLPDGYEAEIRLPVR